MKEYPSQPQDSPVDVLRRMAGGCSTTQVLHTAARLGIADRLGDRRQSSAKLAHTLKVNPQALYRFMRMMVTLKLLDQMGDDSFKLSALGQLLRSDHPEALHERVLYIGQIIYPSADAMLHAVRTGRPAFDRALGVPFFDYLARRPELSAYFNRQMSLNFAERLPGLMAAYEFSGAGTVVDVGGGDGALLVAILRAKPRARGVLFDSPIVIAEAEKRLSKANVSNRCRTVAGNFFRDPVPWGGDVYVLSNIIHDWNDARSLRILKRCRAAIRPTGKLLVIEEIMPRRVVDAPATVGVDFSMLLLTGGQERTRAQYRELLGRAGFRLAKVIPFAPTQIHSGRKSNWAILECKPAARNGPGARPRQNDTVSV